MNIPRARFEHRIENISFRVKNSRRFGSNGVERDCSRFWGRVWRSLYILVYNKKREEASRVGGKVAYLIVRRKVHPDTKSTMKACYHLPLNTRWILKIYLAKRKEMLSILSYFIPLSRVWNNFISILSKYFEEKYFNFTTMNFQR